MTKNQMMAKMEEMTALLNAMTRKVETLEAEKRAAERGSYMVRGEDYYTTATKVPAVAVLLSPKEYDSIREEMERKVSDWAGEGKLIRGSWDSECIMEIDFSDSELLPQYAGYVIHYTYSHGNGTWLSRVWGLVRVSR